jgi:hypothetical protein
VQPTNARDCHEAAVSTGGFDLGAGDASHIEDSNALSLQVSPELVAIADEVIE